MEDVVESLDGGLLSELDENVGHGFRLLVLVLLVVVVVLGVVPD
jgi:hypothetical protein